MIAQIGIDYNLCKDPLGCRKCLSVCPSVVFVCGPTKIWKGRETDPSEYKIIGRYFDKCSGCGDCVKGCPTGAINLEFLPREQLAQKFREERTMTGKGELSMTLDFKILQKVKGNPSKEVAPGRRLKSVPNQDYAYDLPKELIYKVHQEFSMESLYNPDGETSADYLANQGRTFMNLVIREADSKEFLDRTGEMIEHVAQQTGIRFPHVLERYIELGILTLRPRDAWTVTEATTKALKVRSFNCSLGKLLADQGINDCQVFCMAANEVAAQKAGTQVSMTYSKDVSGSGLCEFAFRLQQGG